MLMRLVLASALALPVFAFHDDRHDRDDNNGRWSRRDDSRSRGRWERNSRRSDPYAYGNSRAPYGYGTNRDSYGYGNNSGYGTNRGAYGYGNNSGYGTQTAGIVNRTMRDLQSAAARNRVDGHERDHFNRAMGELQNIAYSQGSMDSRSLSRVLEALDHLSRADQIDPRDRQVLARDRQALASLYGGYGYDIW